MKTVGLALFTFGMVGFVLAVTVRHEIVIAFYAAVAVAFSIIFGIAMIIAGLDEYK